MTVHDAIENEKTIEALRRENAELKDIIREIVYSAGGDCVWCGAWPECLHSSECRIAKFIQ